MGFDTGPYVNVATFCERAIQDTEGVLTLVRITDQLVVQSTGPDAPQDLPEGTVITTTLVVILKPGEARGSQPFKVDLETPSGEIKTGPEMSIPFAGGPNNGANVVLPMTIGISSAGLYWANVYVAHRLVTRVPLQISYQYLRGAGGS
jgi:hypothetical protein